MSGWEGWKGTTRDPGGDKNVLYPDSSSVGVLVVTGCDTYAVSLQDVSTGGSRGKGTQNLFPFPTTACVSKMISKSGRLGGSVS